MKLWDMLQADWKQSQDEWSNLSRSKKIWILFDFVLFWGIGLFILAYFAFMYVPLSKDFINSIKVMTDDVTVSFELKQFLAYQTVFGFATLLLFTFLGLYFILLTISHESDNKIELKKLKKEVQELRDKIAVTEQ